MELEWSQVLVLPTKPGTDFACSIRDVLMIEVVISIDRELIPILKNS